MTKRVFIIPDVYKKDTWSCENVDDVCAYLKSEFGFWPENTRIYHNAIAQSCDVTPSDARSIAHLQGLEGTFYVVIYPDAGPLLIAYYVVMAVMVAYSVYAIATMPKPAVASPQSANNDLAARQNQARLGGRIPDIFGTVRSTPDLIALPYTYYDEVTGKEIETCVMVIGRGYHEIHDCRDGETDVRDIPGTSVSIYDPFTDITGTPIYQVGKSFTEPPLYVKKSNSINGQTLDMPNNQKIESTELYFESPNKIKARVPYFIEYVTVGGVSLPFERHFDYYFSTGDSLGIYGAQFGVADANLTGSITIDGSNTLFIDSALNIELPANYKGLLLTGALVEISSGNYKDFSGQFAVSDVVKTVITGGYRYAITLDAPESDNPNWSLITSTDYTINAGAVLNQNINSVLLDENYTVESVSETEIVLSSPELVNSDWNKLAGLQGASTQSQTATVRLDALVSKWVGWHTMMMPEATNIMINLNYPNGLYWQSRSGRIDPNPSVVYIEWQQVDVEGDPFGEVYTDSSSIFKLERNAFGITVKKSLGFTGSFRFRLSRSTPDGADANARDTVKVKEVYGFTPSNVLNYGNVTVVRTESIGIEGALALKERKINSLLTKKLPLNGTGPLTATRSAGQTMIALVLDDKIGRMTLADVDVDQINAEIDKVNAYFGTSVASEFCYTFDSDNLSFQESAGMVASAAFSEPYRFGNVNRLKFECPQNNSVLLFNHRNKVPKSETRTRTYGINKNYDGIELEYTSNVDDARIKYHIPEDQSAKNPLKITTSGIRNAMQAKTRAWREWNKLKYQKLSVQFDALDESELLIRNDRIIVADNTRQDTQDGEVESVELLTITTSQPCVFDPAKSYFIYLQMDDGTVDMIGCHGTTDPYKVSLDRAPMRPFVTAEDRYIKTTYFIVDSTSGQKSVCMLTLMDPSGKMTNTVTAINYDDRYYQDDIRPLGFGNNYGMNWGVKW